MPLTWAIGMAITAGKYVPAMMHPEMLFVAHVHQPGVASPAVRVDAASALPDPGSLSVAASSRRQGRFPCNLPVAFQDSEDDRFTARSATLFPRTRRAPK